MTPPENRFDGPYFDAGRCPVCRTPRTSARCTGCGVSYADPRMSDLGRTLVRADLIRRDLRAHPAAPDQAQATPQTQTPAPAAAQAQGPARGRPDMVPPAVPSTANQTGAAAPDTAAGQPRQSPSVGWVLLGVGALCLVIAAGIFVAVSWGTLGWAARAAILFAVTLITAASAEGTRRQGLRASAETLGGVAGALWAGTLLAATRALPYHSLSVAFIGLALGAVAV
ncbi:MAG: DUF2157 domain-containing protein, partial [Propionibacteriaceae bacterium]|nr:DUF2157 domain-containing protein [Propionibacteriaceae bacterium]